MRVPSIELLWWEGCPSTERALADLRSAMAETGLDAAAIVTREIRTDDEAAGAGFTGSPTILVDGVDVAGAEPDEPGGPGGPGEPGEPTGLTCRIYRRRDGRIAPTPDPLDLRDALVAATRREEVTP